MPGRFFYVEVVGLGSGSACLDLGGRVDWVGCWRGILLLRSPATSWPGHPPKEVTTDGGSNDRCPSLTLRAMKERQWIYGVLWGWLIESLSSATSKSSSVCWVGVTAFGW
jgi:hypothetical protein